MGVVDQRQPDHVSSTGSFNLFLVLFNAEKQGTWLDQENVLKKLAQIEEQAQSTLAEFPSLAKQRLRMIIALARYLRAEISSSGCEAPGKRPAQRGDDDDTVPSRS